MRYKVLIKRFIRIELLKYKYREKIDRKMLGEYSGYTNGISKFNIYEKFTGVSKNEDLLMIEMIINDMQKLDELKKLYLDMKDFMKKVTIENKNFLNLYRNERRRFRIFLKKTYIPNPATVKLLDNLTYLIPDEKIFLEKINLFIKHLENNYKDKLN